MTINPTYPANLPGQATAAMAWSPQGVGTAATIDVQQALKTLWRRRRFIALVAALFLALGVAFLLLSPPRYQSAAELIIDPLGLQVVKNEVSPDPQSADANVAVVENEMRVISSASVLNPVIDQEHLTDDPEFVGGSFLSNLFGAARQLFLPRQAGVDDARLEALQALKKHLAVRRTERSFVVDVIVWTKDAAKSARIANAIVQTYITSSVSERADLARRSSVALQARLGQLSAQVNDVENRVETYKREHHLVDAEGHLVTNQQLAEINTRLTDAKTATAAAAAKLQQFETLKAGAEGGISEAVDSPTLAQLRSQAAEVERHRAQLVLTLGPKHPELLNVDAELTGINAAIQAEVARIGASLRANYARALANQQTLQQAFDRLSVTATESSQALVKLRELEREAQANQTVYETFLARSRELGEQTAVDTTNIRLISAATEPLSKSNLSARLVLPAFLLLGLLLGAGIVIAPIVFGFGRNATVNPG